jgi:hypothetical protein
MSAFKLRPELDQPKYYIHLLVISGIVLGILQLWQGGEMLTFVNWVVSAGLILVGDVIAHTVLRLD